MLTTTCRVLGVFATDRIGATSSRTSLAVQQARADVLPFGDNAFDAAVSCNIFHYCRHPLAALSEMQRALRPDGTIVITDLCADFFICRLYDIWLFVSPAHARVYTVRGFTKLLQQTG